MYRFPSNEWIKAMMRELNQIQSYKEAAKNWEGDFYFFIEPSGVFTETVIL